MLDLYFEEHGKLPLVDGSTDLERWEELTKYFTEEFGGLPKHPRSPQYSYDYRPFENAHSYVLKAPLGRPVEDYLKYAPEDYKDVDGLVGGVDCGPGGPRDTIYCIVRSLRRSND